jgi:hypothetical protein
MSYDEGYDEGYRAGMQKMREVGQVRTEELEAKLAKAVDLIESAYNEGFGEGIDDVQMMSGGKTWYESRSRKRLAELEGRDT